MASPSLRGRGHFCVEIPMTTCARRNEKHRWPSVDSVVRGAIADGFLSVSCPTALTIATIERVCETLSMSVEAAPRFCPNGHPLAANTCLVGWEVCACTQAENGGHRTNYCKRCDETVRTPLFAGAMPQTDRWKNRS
jgi:hypothetical protein